MVLIEAKQDIPQAGAAIVRNTNKYQGFGPEIGIECFRPIGLTRLELLSGVHAPPCSEDVTGCLMRREFRAMTFYN